MQVDVPLLETVTLDELGAMDDDDTTMLDELTFDDDEIATLDEDVFEELLAVLLLETWQVPMEGTCSLNAVSTAEFQLLSALN